MRNIYLTFLYFCLLLFSPLCLMAQQTFKAKVIDQNQIPIRMAIVAVLDVNNNELSSSVTDSLGTFEINIPHDMQDKMLYIRAFGSTALREPLQIAIQRLSFVISQDAILLQEVSIQAKHLSVERSANSYTISNIYTAPIAVGRNIVEVLKYAPLVNVSTAGDLEILNKGKATIYVNGRKSNMDPQNIPAENIEKIEVITNPGSEYPSTDRNGILNIILRKAPEDGVIGNITLGDSQQEKWSLNSPEINAFMSIQKKKINASLNFGLSYYPDFLKETSVYDYLLNNHSVQIISNNTERKIGGYANILLDWHISPNQDIGFQFGSSFLQPITDYTFTESIYTNLLSNQIDSMDFTKRSLQTKMQYNLFGNVNYTLKVNDKQKLILDFFYTHSVKDNPYYYTYQNSSMEESRLSKYQSHSRSDIDALDFKANYLYQINHQLSFKAGFNSYGALTDYDFFYGNKIGDAYISDTMKSNHFDFKDITTAVYANLDWEISSKLSLSAGLRGELYGYKGIQSVTNTIVSDKMPNIFPSLSLVYYAGDNHEIDLDFTSRLHIPGYSQRNPFEVYYSPSLYKANNISLRPSKSYDVNLLYTFFQDYRLNLWYSFSKDSWATFYIPESDGVTRITELNYGNNHKFYGSLSADKSLFRDFLMLSVQVDIAYDIYTVTSQQVTAYNTQPTLSYDFDISLSTALNKKQTWLLSTRFAYASPLSGIGANYSNNYYLEANVLKAFKYCTLAFGVDDILNWQTKIHLNTDTYSFSLAKYNYCRTYWIRFNMKFGNMKTKSVQKRSSSIQERL